MMVVAEWQTSPSRLTRYHGKSIERERLVETISFSCSLRRRVSKIVLEARTGPGRDSNADLHCILALLQREGTVIATRGCPPHTGTTMLTLSIFRIRERSQILQKELLSSQSKESCVQDSDKEQELKCRMARRSLCFVRSATATPVSLIILQIATPYKIKSSCWWNFGTVTG